jgi:putative nucleotidyltransferase with HDIG domain
VTPIRIYAVAQTLLAIPAVALAFALAGVGSLPAVIALALVAGMAERRQLVLSPQLQVSVSFLPLILAAVLFGPGAAVVVGAAAIVAAPEFPWERFAIHLSGRALVGVCGGSAAAAVLSGHTPTLALLVLASAVAGVAGNSVEFMVTATTLTIRRRVGPADLWRMVRSSLAVSIALYAPLTALFAYAYHGSGAWMLVFFVIPMVAAHLGLGLHARQAQLIEELEATNDQLAGANIHLRKVNLSFASAMVRALDARDRYTAGHSAAVAVYSRDIARELNMPAEDVERVHLCALVHDIGKIGLPAEVLEKTTALNDEEWAKMREHAAIGSEILGEVEDYADVAAIVRSHHERHDGAGYPDGLSGDAIPRLARVIAVADSYNAMTSDRPYRRAMSPERAIQQLILGKGSQFEPMLVDAFLTVLQRESEPYRRGLLADFSLEAIQHGTLGPAVPARPILRAAVA